jgi:hypothetical protein
MSMPAMNRFKRLDVRPLFARGEEPLATILLRIHALGVDDGLLLIAPMLPAPLIERMGGEGFDSKVERGDAGSWIVYFWRRAR